MNIVILGSTLSSELLYVHASTYRKLIRELHRLGHNVLFLERAVNKNQTSQQVSSDFNLCESNFYSSLNELKKAFSESVKEADMVIVGSKVPQGIEVGEWVTKTTKGLRVFYDLETLDTLEKLKSDSCEYIRKDLVSQYDLYLSVVGGAALVELEKTYGSQMARPLYHAVNTGMYHPELAELNWDLGYLGDFEDDKLKLFDSLMLDVAKKWPLGRFVVAGTGYSTSEQWPNNIQKIEIPPRKEHCHFYNNQRFALNLTSGNALKLGYAPSLNLFEAAGCCTPVITNYWPGLESFFKIGEEILVAKSSKDVLRYLSQICKSERKLIGERARKKVLAHHTISNRVQTLLQYADTLISPTSDKLIA